MTKPLTTDERACRAHLEAWAQRLNELMRSYNELLQQRDADIEQLRATYRQVKDNLCAECKRYATDSARAELTPTERRLCDRPIRHAAVALRVPINATAQKQFEALSKAHSDFTLAISRIKGGA
jgi:hypothetical protein